MRTVKAAILTIFLFCNVPSFSQIPIVVTPVTRDNYSPSEPNYHYYPKETFICKADKFTVDEVYQKIISRARFLAPVYDDNQQAYDGCTLLLHISMPGLSFPGYHPIQVKFNELEHRITNYTLPAHVLHPGKVDRQIVERDGNIYLQTRGVGAISVDKFFTVNLQYEECLVSFLISNGLTAAEKLYFGKPLEKLAAWLNEVECVVDYVWSPVDDGFARFISGLPDKKDLTSPELTTAFIWEAAFSSAATENGMLVHDNGARKTEIDEQYNYTVNGVEKSVVLFFTYNYTDGEKAWCHACSPGPALARFSKRDGLWSLEAFENKDLVGLSGPWGKPSQISFTRRSGKVYVVGTGEDMHQGIVDKWTVYYDLETFKQGDFK